MLDESKIREALAGCLMRNSNDKIRVFDELAIGKSIADIVAISDCIVGYEIKSDQDTYVRLESQIKMYDKFCNYCYLVIGAKHIKSACAKIPEHWGLIVVKENENKSIFLEALREPKKNMLVDLSKQLSLLWGNELATITKACKLCKGAISKSKMQQLLIKNVPHQKLLAHICNQLFERDYTKNGKMMRKVY